MSYTSIGDVFRYDSDNWDDVDFLFEAYYRATTGTAYARLYDLTASAAVTDGELDTTETTFQRERTGALTLTNEHVYECQVGKSGSDAGEIRGAKIIAI